jgi:hypothetical protein
MPTRVGSADDLGGASGSAPSVSGSLVLSREDFAARRPGTAAVMQTDMTQERIALNQSTFREANERIEAAADKMALLGPVPFICECPERRCMEIVRLTLDAYEAVRQHSRRFFSAPGHHQLAVAAGAAVVIEQTAGYVIAEKVGEAGEVAEEQYEKLSEGTDG